MAPETWVPRTRVLEGRLTINTEEPGAWHLLNTLLISKAHSLNISSVPPKILGVELPTFFYVVLDLVLLTRVSLHLGLTE